MEMWDGLARNIVNEDHRPIRFKARFNRPLKPLCFHEEFLHPVRGKSLSRRTWIFGINSTCPWNSGR